MSDAEAVVEETETSAGFKAIGEQRFFAEYFEQFDALADEMKLHLNDGGLFGIVVDPASVGMVRNSLDREALEHYSATGGVIGLNISRMLDILGMGKSGDLVELTLDTETRKLHIQVDGLSYTLALIDPDSIRREPEIPEDLDLDANVTVAFEDLKRGITAADMVSDHVRFRDGDERRRQNRVLHRGRRRHRRRGSGADPREAGRDRRGARRRRLAVLTRLPSRISRSRFRKTPRSGSNWAKSIRSSCTTDTRRWATTPSLATAR